MPYPLNPVDCDDSRPERREPPGEWEPEPLHLPLDVPRHRPGRPPADDNPSPPESRVIVIDLA